MAAMHRNPYAELLAIGAELDHHESDLYAKYTPEVMALVKDTGCTFSTFISQIDGKLWLDIPFAYLPFWERRQSRVSADKA